VFLGVFITPFLILFSKQVVGRTSSWIDPDAPDAALAADSAAALTQELAWAAHLSLQAVIVPAPDAAPARLGPRAARCVNAALRGLATTAIWARLPLVCEGDDEDASWAAWARVRGLAEHASRLGVMLDLPSAPPPDDAASLASAVARWLGEPLRAIGLPASAFVAGRGGRPTLPRAHAAAVGAAFRGGVQVVLTGEPALAPPPVPGAPCSLPAPTAAARAAWECLASLFRAPPDPDPDAAASLPYRDYLQAPLQPLQDNLESATYETFERDAPKYDGYRAAVAACLADRVAAAAEADAGAAPPTTRVMVVGAGRGPLVRATLAAADAVGAPVTVVAVEKNANAVITLQGLLASEAAWRGRVSVVAADMRRYTPPAPADVLVSELLGSFGDNELSPECLDGAQRFLIGGGAGVSIPAAYTSHLHPVTAAKLWSDAAAADDALKSLETPYVVKLHRVTPCAPPAPVFTFAHPRPGAADPGDDPAAANARFGTVVFERAGERAATIHGLAGYFDATLYASPAEPATPPITLSTHPATHTPGMHSWFPIFFPLVKPMDVGAGESVTVHMWRVCGGGRVWYEWAVEAGGGGRSNIHNPGGRSYFVGL
jgi:protein arginine N-methyltransferase 5